MDPYLLPKRRVYCIIFYPIVVIDTYLSIVTVQFRTGMSIRDSNSMFALVPIDLLAKEEKRRGVPYDTRKCPGSSHSGAIKRGRRVRRKMRKCPSRV